MNNIDKIFQSSANIKSFAEGYFNYLAEIFSNIDTESIEKMAKEFEEARNNGNTIFIIGNGGSATTASSMANDIGFDIIKKSGTDIPFKVMALTDNNSVLTAIANDVGYENIFLNQLKIHYKKGDKVVAISASGNSPNVVKAVDWVKNQGGTTIAFLGFSGGKLKEIVDLGVMVPSEPGEYGPVEDLHLIFNHILAHWFQVKLKHN